MTATSRASPPGHDGGMVTVEAAVSLCAFVTVLAMVLAGTSMVLDQLRCTDAAREAARLVARGEQDRVGDAVRRIAPDGATVAVRTVGDGIEVSVRDPAAGGLLPGVRVGADAYAVPEPDSTPDSTEESARPAGGEGR
jgi:Flp pilus assembly protein TadG